MGKGFIFIMHILAFGLCFNVAVGQPKKNADTSRYYNQTANTLLIREDTLYFLYEYDSLQRLKSISPCHYYIDTISDWDPIEVKYLGLVITSGFRTNHEGLYRAFDTLGNLSEKGHYHESTKIGEWQTFHSNGQLISFVTYEFYDFGMSAAHGWAWVYHPNGNVKCKGKFDNGNRVGRWTWYYENGQKELEMSFNQGMPDGDYTSYYSNGKVAMTGNHKYVVTPGEENFVPEPLNAMPKPDGQCSAAYSIETIAYSQKSGQWCIYLPVKDNAAKLKNCLNYDNYSLEDREPEPFPEYFIPLEYDSRWIID